MIARETGTRTRTKQAEQLLEALHPRGSIFCVAQFHPDDRRQHRYRHPKSPYSGAKLALEWAADDRFIGTYAGVASLRSAPKRGRGTEADVLDVRAVWVEVDACDFGAIAEARAELVAGGMKKKAAKERAWREAPDEARQAALDDAFRALEGAPFEPSILVFSGRGWHAYWLLADPAEGPALALVKACNRAMAERTNGDTVHDLARVLRVPSTWHRKDPANPVRCELYNFEPSYRYTLAELVERLEVDPELAAEEWAGKPRRKASPRGKASDRETIGALPPVPPGWHRYRENSQKADDAWHGRGYSDRSEPAMAIANLAVRSGEAETLDEVLAILDASPACGAWVQEKPRAAIRTAEKALAENPRPKADRRSRPTGGASAAREPLLEVGRRKRPVYADDARGKVCDRAGRTLHLGDTVKCHDGGGKRRRADAGPNIGFIVGLGEDGKATVYFEHEDEDDGKVYANTARLGPADLEYHGKATGAAEAQEAMEPWDDPLPLEDAGLPEMGVRALFRGLPAPLALVEATARAVQMKPCPVAHAVLCAAGMAIAPKFRIVLQGEPRPVAGFGLIVMPSGAGKSPAVGIATGPLAELEDEQRASEEGREKVAAWEAKRDVVEGEIRSIKARLGRKSKSGEENKATLREALEAAYLRRSMLGEHPLPNRFLSDVTSECLGELMADIIEVQGRIRQAFYADLFLMLAASDRRQITATEIEDSGRSDLKEILDVVLMVAGVVALFFPLTAPFVIAIFALSAIALAVTTILYVTKEPYPETGETVSGWDVGLSAAGVLLSAGSSFQAFRAARGLPSSFTVQSGLTSLATKHQQMYSVATGADDAAAAAAALDIKILPMPPGTSLTTGLGGVIRSPGGIRALFGLGKDTKGAYDTITGIADMPDALVAADQLTLERSVDVFPQIAYRNRFPEERSWFDQQFLPPDLEPVIIPANP